MPIVPPELFHPAPQVDFPWDEAETLGYVYFLPGDIHDRLSKLTHNANLALSIGCATWILARFAPFDSGFKPRFKGCQRLDDVAGEIEHPH